MEGKKYDQDKAPLYRGCLSYFPNALMAVADVSKYGVEKYKTEYAERNWSIVKDAIDRYQDAALRHVCLQDFRPWDQESGRLHLAHAAWSLLAALELSLQQNFSQIDPVKEINLDMKQIMNEIDRLQKIEDWSE